MLNIPKELVYIIFEHLSSKNRSEICSVSHQFEQISLEVSVKYHSTKLNDIYMDRNYHLLVRLKDKRLINLELACQTGDMDLVELMISKGDNRWNYGLDGACKGSHMSIVELMISKGANNWNNGLYGACQGGHMSIVELMISKGANDWNYGLYCACRGGHMSIVELMISKGANDWNLGLYGACRGGHMSIVELMISKGANKCTNCQKTIQDHLIIH